LQATNLSNKGFRNPPELREKSQISVPRRLHKFCLNTKRNNKLVGAENNKTKQNRKF